MAPDALYGNVELSSAVAEQIAAGWYQQPASALQYITLYDHPPAPNPLSPVDGWIPDGMGQLRPIIDNRVSSGSSASSEQARTPTGVDHGNLPIPRYVSSSAYPVGNISINDRVTSFSSYAVHAAEVASSEELGDVVDPVTKRDTRRGRIVGGSYRE